MAAHLPSIGASAPEFVVHGARGALAPASTGEPRVLAFVRDWSAERAAPEDLRAIRAHLRGLGAELIVLADSGVWSFRPDDDLDRVADYSDRLAGDISTAALLYGVRDRRDAVFVIDEGGVIRFAHRELAIARPGSVGPRSNAERCGESMGARLADALETASEAVLAPPPATFTRREWVASCLVAGFAFTFLRACKAREAAPPPAPAPVVPTPASEVDIELEINGKKHPLRIEPRVSLLDALRERIGLTGTKKGCDAGQCGACTVHIAGKRVLSCLTLAVTAQGKPITTIEGLAKGPRMERDGFTPARGEDELHPIQQAFVEHDAFQCGFCTPGQIMSAVALLAEGHAKTDDDIREFMSGNLCRCGAYPNIVAAIRAVGGRK